MAPPVVGKRCRVEVGRKYCFEMRSGMDRWGAVQQVLPDTYVVTLLEPVVVADAVLPAGSQCMVQRGLVTGVREVV